MNEPLCVCAHNEDGTRTTILCPIHAKYDPCLTMATVTGKRRQGSLKNGRCTHCGWREPLPTHCSFAWYSPVHGEVQCLLLKHHPTSHRWEDAEGKNWATVNLGWEGAEHLHGRWLGEE